MAEKTVTFRFYAELNDFLPAERRGRPFSFSFTVSPSVKDAIEGLGVPHPEVDLIVVDGRSVGFDYRLCDRDRVSVYPVFESLDVTPVVRLRPAPLRDTRFVLDGHLGKLARTLRMLGFDSLYQPDFDDADIVRISAAERRIILTRDVELLKANAVTHGYWVRSTSPDTQAREVIERLDLRSQFRPFRLCVVCNGEIERVDKDTVLSELPENVEKRHDEFCRCAGCHKVYWKGSHYQAMMDRVKSLS